MLKKIINLIFKRKENITSPIILPETFVELNEEAKLNIIG